jgi:hypothetical protein
MEVSDIVLIMTCVFSGISILISIFNLTTIRNISNSEGYINTITASRENWMNELRVNASSYLSVVDVFFVLSKDNAICKYEEMLKYKYAVTITLYQYEDDIEIKEKMDQIQTILWEYINNNFEVTVETKRQVNDLNNTIYRIINKKYEFEWNKQKAEVNGKRFISVEIND